MKKLPYIIIVLLVVVVVVLSLGTCRHTPPAERDSDEWRDTIYDTIPCYFPVARDSVVLRWETIPVPVRDSTIAEVDSLPAPFIVSNSNDSATISIPISQKVYEDSTYRAYVSGYRPSLDSIFIFRPTEKIYIRSPTKQKRFSVGVQCGYGMTPKGFQPYVGVGVSATLFSF